MELNSSRDAMEDAQIYKTCTDLDEGVAITSNKSKRKSGLSFNITLDQLQLHAGKKLCDVAKELGVGRSTIKRACRDYGIIRWPNSKNKKNPSLFMASTQSDRVGNSKRQSVVKTRDDTTRRPNLLLHQQPILDDNIGKCNQNVAKLTKNETVIIKATFGEDTVKFKLDISYKMDKLNQEVASRFDIEVGSFKLKYLDGDSNWILVGRDDDLQSWINNLKELGQTKVEVSVQSILMKEELISFKVSSGIQIGEELVIEVITFGTASKFDSLCQCEPGELPVRFIPCKQQSDAQQRTSQAICDACDELRSSRDATEVHQDNMNCSDLNFGKDVIEMDLNSSVNVIEGEQNNTNGIDLHSNRDVMEGEPNNPVNANLDEEVLIDENKNNRKSFNITYEQIKLHFGKKLDAAAKELGVSKATLKRVKNRFGITRWPSHPKNKNNPSLYEASSPSNHVGTSKRQRVVNSRDNNFVSPNRALCQQPILEVNVRECNKNFVEFAGDEVVTIKAAFGEDTVMFELNKFSKMDNLNQEVASRFDIAVGSFKLKYLDEDGDWIVLRRDDELELCIKTMKRLDKTKVKISVESIGK